MMVSLLYILYYTGYLIDLEFVRDSTCYHQNHQIRNLIPSNSSKMAHENKMRNYIIEKKFLLPTYLILLPNNKCIPKLQQYLPIPSHPSPRKKKFKSQKNVSYPDLCSP